MDVYGFNSKRYVAINCAADRRRILRVMELIGQSGDVLDIGCMDGAIAARLRDLGNRVYGIDASKPAVATARERGIDAQIGNLEETLPFADEMFDLVFAGEIIEHVYAIDALLTEIRRTLKPGGILVVTTPNLAAFGRRILLLLNRNPHIEISFKGDAAGHIRYFVKSTLCRLLEDHRFRITAFTSDVVNFNHSGTRASGWLASVFPTYGRSLIVRAQKCD